jgi:hypothetical protein
MFHLEKVSSKSFRSLTSAFGNTSRRMFLNVSSNNLSCHLQGYCPWGGFITFSPYHMVPQNTLSSTSYPQHGIYEIFFITSFQDLTWSPKHLSSPHFINHVVEPWWRTPRSSVSHNFGFTCYSLRDLPVYNRFQNLAKALTVKMATVVFVETL